MTKNCHRPKNSSGVSGGTIASPLVVRNGKEEAIVSKKIYFTISSGDTSVGFRHCGLHS
eukprot:SAG11_NODE_34351_length_272_cov_0.901734_1_plen_58_part_01